MVVVDIAENFDVEVSKAFESLLIAARASNPGTDQAYLQRVFEYALRYHQGQCRRSGEPYILHPLAVAKILTEFQMGDEVLAAALLHDVVEDCGVSKEQIAGEFGAEIAQLVDGVTKLKHSD